MQEIKSYSTQNKKCRILEGVMPADLRGLAPIVDALIAGDIELGSLVVLLALILALLVASQRLSREGIYDAEESY